MKTLLTDSELRAATKNEMRRALHAEAVSLMRRVLDLGGTHYKGCGFHWALERSAGRILSQVADYDKPFTHETLDDLQGAYEDLVKRVEKIEGSRGEQALCARMVAASDAEASVNREIEAHFRPLVEERLAKGDVDGARGIVSRIPDCVSRVFMLDAIRNAGR